MSQNIFTIDDYIICEYFIYDLLKEYRKTEYKGFNLKKVIEKEVQQLEAQFNTPPKLPAEHIANNSPYDYEAAFILFNKEVYYLPVAISSKGIFVYFISSWVESKTLSDCVILSITELNLVNAFDGCEVELEERN